MTKNEFAIYKEISVKDGDYKPFLIFSDSKTSKAPLDGVGMWFNQGNDSTNIEINVIHEVCMVHVVKTSQPPKLKTFRELDESLKLVAKSQFETLKKNNMLNKVTEFSVPIPEGYQSKDYLTLETRKYIGLWFKKRVRGDFDESWNKGKKKQRLLDLS